MSFNRWRSLVDGAEIDVGPAIPDSVVSRPDDDATFDADESDGLTVAFADEFGSFAFRISNNSSGFSRVRVYDYDAGSYVFNKDISAKSAGDTVVVELEVSGNVDYGVEIDNDGSEWTVGFADDGGIDYPYESEDVDIVSQSRNGGQRTGDSANVRAINDIGNPDDVL